MTAGPRLALSLAAIAMGCAGGDRSLPTPAGPTAIDAGRPADGSTLKIRAPALFGPTNLSSTQFMVLDVQNVKGSYASFPVTFEAEVVDRNGTVVARPLFAAATSGFSTSHTITTPFEGDGPFTWRARATYNGAFGPWSNPRTVSAQRGLRIDGLPFPVDSAATPALRAELRRTGFRFDCTGSTTWSSSNPAVATVTPDGILQPGRLGDVSITATCDGIADTRPTRIVEIWTGQYLTLSCSNPGGCGFRHDPGDTGSVELTIEDRTADVQGLLRVSGFPSIRIRGRLSPGGLLDATGELVELHCDSSQYFRIVTIRADGGTAEIRVRQQGLANRPCLATTTFDLDYTSRVRIDALRR